MAAKEAKRTRVFIVEDHALMRGTLADLVNSQDDMEVVGTASRAEDVMTGFASEPPDVAMVDLSLPGVSGDRLATRLRELHPELRVLIVSGHDHELYADLARDAGAHGFVMKDDPERIVQAVRSVARGEPPPS